jgi:hypothetical protein
VAGGKAGDARRTPNVTRAVVLPELDAATYQRHALHADDRTWVEKNCYVDIWIEVVHALGLDPLAMMPFTVAIDFEDDQWTFFKPVHSELYDLYGLDVQELNMWRSMLDQSITHVAAGKLVSTEADAFWLPDTSGTDYKTTHTKTTIVIQDIDVERRRLGYFHNASYYQLEGDDFTHLFRMGEPYDPTFMPLFAEIIRIDRKVKRPLADLQARSRVLLQRHLARRPAAESPFAKFSARFAADLPAIQAEGLPYYHVWAFANLRQIGAAFELVALHSRWLDDPALVPAAEAFEAISTQAKTFIMKAARSVSSKKALDATPIFEEMGAAYQRGIDVLLRAVGEEAR